MRNQNIGKNVWYLFLRYLMITVFVFMCTPLVATNASFVGPILGVLYLFGLVYFFWFTMKVEGEKDVNRVKIGQADRFRWKGAVCALILAVPLIVINLVPLAFPDPVKEEYRGYFTGKVTYLEQDAPFNRELRAVSGKEGYISEITFNEDRQVLRIVYQTSNGYEVLCDGEAESDQRIYSLEEKNEAGESQILYYPENEPDLTEAQGAAFEECKYAIDDIKDVLGIPPNWQTLLTGAKAIGRVALLYFCNLFGDVPAVHSAVYCACMLGLCVAAQVGYEMGYRNIEFLRKKTPVKNSKAGDSVVIQRAHLEDKNED